jgi:hypothetical protein
VISCRKVYRDTKAVADSLPKLGNKEAPPVRDNRIREAVKFPNVFDKALSQFRGRHSRVDRDIVASFREAVYYYHDSIKATSSENGTDKVNRDVFPTLCREREGLKGALVLQPRGSVPVASMTVSSELSAVGTQ